MKIPLGKSAMETFKAYGWQAGGFEVKKFNYIFNFFIGKQCTETKIIEYAIYG